MFALGFSRARRVAQLALLICTACSASESNGEHTTEAICAPVAPTECPDPWPTYPDVAPIFAKRCASCHTAAPDAPWPLDNYSDVVDWAPSIHDELMECLMPPSDSGVAMTTEERQLILTWIRCKYPK